jgi:hypothetical protein
MGFPARKLHFPQRALTTDKMRESHTLFPQFCDLFFAGNSELAQRVRLLI